MKTATRGFLEQQKIHENFIEKDIGLVKFVDPELKGNKVSRISEKSVTESEVFA